MHAENELINIESGVGFSKVMRPSGSIELVDLAVATPEEIADSYKQILNSLKAFGDAKKLLEKKRDEIVDYISKDLEFTVPNMLVTRGVRVGNTKIDVKRFKKDYPAIYEDIHTESVTLGKIEEELGKKTANEYAVRTMKATVQITPDEEELGTRIINRQKELKNED